MSRSRIDILKEIVHAVRMGSAGRCPFCGVYNQEDFRIVDKHEFSDPHKSDCAAVEAYNELLEAGIKIVFPGNRWIVYK